MRRVCLSSICLLLSCLVLIACSPTPQPPPAKADQEPSVLEERYQPIERAKAVEADVLEQKRKQDAQIEEQGG